MPGAQLGTQRKPIAIRKHDIQQDDIIVVPEKRQRFAEAFCPGYFIEVFLNQIILNDAGNLGIVLYH